MDLQFCIKVIGGTQKSLEYHKALSLKIFDESNFIESLACDLFLWLLFNIQKVGFALIDLTYVDDKHLNTENRLVIIRGEGDDGERKRGK